MIRHKGERSNKQHFTLIPIHKRKTRLWKTDAPSTAIPRRQDGNTEARNTNGATQNDELHYFRAGGTSLTSDVSDNTSGPQMTGYDKMTRGQSNSQKRERTAAGLFDSWAKRSPPSESSGARSSERRRFDHGWEYTGPSGCNNSNETNGREHENGST